MRTSPYLSVVVTTRNDNHGGSMTRRMQAFINGLAAQCERHGVDAELVMVEWNPPSDRVGLSEELQWQQTSESLRVRIIRVPPSIHNRYSGSLSLPLYQMIGKNVGIRRARGEFILVTNVDIIFSDELFAYLSKKQLKAGRLYRADRWDAGSEVPLSSIDDQLKYCAETVHRVNAKEGTFLVDKNGRRQLSDHDVARADSGITFGHGFFGPESWEVNRPLRCGFGMADIHLPVHRPSSSLLLRMSAGPSVAIGPLKLLVLIDGVAVGYYEISGSTVFKVEVGEASKISFCCLNTGLRTHGIRSLEFCLHEVSWITKSHAQVEYGNPTDQEPDSLATRASQWSADRALAYESADWIPYLHQTACGDFMLMHRDVWFSMEGYAEFAAYSMNVDTLGAYTAYFFGADEVVLEDCMRIYHIEHGQGSGWTPEGESQLRGRLAARGVEWIEFADVLKLIEHMRKEGGIRFNEGRWGVDSDGLAEGDPLLEFELFHGETKSFRPVLPTALAADELHTARALEGVPLDLITDGILDDKPLINYLTSIWEYANGVSTVTSRPWKVTLPLADLCNASCTFCNSWIRGSRVVSLDEILKMEDVFRFAFNLSIQGHGEPMAHPRFFEIITYLKNIIDPRCRVDMITNGALIYENRDELARSSINIYNISLNAATPETHQQIMDLGEGAFGKIVESIKWLVDVRDKEAGANVRAITLSMVIIKQNIAEVPAFIELANVLKVDRILLRELMPVNGLQAGLNYHTLPPKDHPDFQALKSAAEDAISKSRVPVLADPDGWGRDIFPKDIENEIRVNVPELVSRREARRVSRRDLTVVEQAQPRQYRGRKVETGIAINPKGGSGARSGHYHCGYPYFNFMWTDFSFRLPPCCYADSVTGFEPVHFDGSYPFDLAWNSPALVGLRSSLRSGPLLPECQRCPAQPQPFDAATFKTPNLSKLMDSLRGSPSVTSVANGAWEALSAVLKRIPSNKVARFVPANSTRVLADTKILKIESVARKWEFIATALVPLNWSSGKGLVGELDVVIYSGEVGLCIVRHDNVSVTAETVGVASRNGRSVTLRVETSDWLEGDFFVLRNRASTGIETTMDIGDLVVRVP